MLFLRRQRQWLLLPLRFHIILLFQMQIHALLLIRPMTFLSHNNNHDLCWKQFSSSSSSSISSSSTRTRMTMTTTGGSTNSQGKGKSKGGGCGCGGKSKGKNKSDTTSKGNDKNNKNNKGKFGLLSFAVSSGYFPEPAFRVMNTGEGSVSIITNNNDRSIKVKLENDNDNGNNNGPDNGNEASSKVTITKTSMLNDDCQFAQFGPRLSFSGCIELASPLEAHVPIVSLSSSSSSRNKKVVVVKRGLCSFESKWKTIMAMNDDDVSGVILVNDDDDTFLAVADTAPPSTEDDNSDKETTKTIISPPPQLFKNEIPFVVVSSSTGITLTHGNHVSIEPLGDGISTCWGKWNIRKQQQEEVREKESSLLSSSSELVASLISNNDVKTEEKGATMIDTDHNINDEEEQMVLPLFPVSKEPLLPGATLQMSLGRRECDELEQQYHHQKKNQHHPQNRTSENNTNSAIIIRVVVVFCADPYTNVLAEKACLADVTLLTKQRLQQQQQQKGQQQQQSSLVTVKGITPCKIRTLVRDSTRSSFGLALVEKIKTQSAVPYTTATTSTTTNANAYTVSTSTSTRAEAKHVLEKLRSIGLYACVQASTEGFCDIRTMDTIDYEIDTTLPSSNDDPDGLSFAVCALLDLPPRQMQAALACTTMERFHGISQILNRIETRNRDICEADDDDDEQHDDNEDSDNLDNNNDYNVKCPPFLRSRNFVSKAVKKALPSVVRVEIPSGSGENKAAGFIIGNDGIIVTNRHVVATESSDNDSSSSLSSLSPVVLITFQDGVTLPASILAVSEKYDIAFLKVDDSNHQDHHPSKGEQPLRFPVAPIGNSDDVQLGDWIISIGSPAEFDNLVSLGIASTIQRPKVAPNTKLMLDRSATFIGTDALFNKGISGGPLLNDAGYIVGMCTYRREDLNGLGFAIAINRVVDVAHELLHGRDITATPIQKIPND